MLKAIASKVQINNNDSAVAKEFLSYIEEILNNENFRELNKFTQHCNTNRMQHCINVSYYSFLWAKSFGCDAKSAARSGLLHDFYLYDRHETKLKENHLLYHPKIAYQNSIKITNLNDIEKDAILKHMFPICKGLPKYKESYIVTFADKYSTILEVCFQLSKKLIFKFIPQKLLSQNK